MNVRVRRRACGERGAAAVEFALLLPILLMLVFGIIQYGLYFWAMQGGADIARDAARKAAVGAPAQCSGFKSEVEDEIDDLAGSGGTAQIERTYVASDSTAGVQIGDNVEVHVEFTSFDLHIPMVPFIHDGEVSSSAQARVEYLPSTLEDLSAPEDCS